MSNTSFRITRKGQVTLPKNIRKHLGVSEGEAVRFEIDADGDVVVKADHAPSIAPDVDAYLKRIDKANRRAAGKMTLLGKTEEEFIAFVRGDI